MNFTVSVKCRDVICHPSYYHIMQLLTDIKARLKIETLSLFTLKHINEKLENKHLDINYKPF